MASVHPGQGPFQGDTAEEVGLHRRGAKALNRTTIAWCTHTSNPIYAVLKGDGVLDGRVWREWPES